MIEHVVLVGLSGSGKSTTAQELATLLGWKVADLDALIERKTGRSIPDIFRADGEAAFRQIEGAVFREVLAEANLVIATGGGAVIDSAIWQEQWLGHPRVLTVWLDASTSTLVDRLMAQAASEGDRATRPLLEGDAVARIEAMRQNRLSAYSRAQLTVDVTSRTPVQVAVDIAELASLASGCPSSFELQVESARSNISVGPGVRVMLADEIHRVTPGARQVFIAVDQSVRPHVSSLLGGLEATLGLPVHVRSVPSGEGSKSVEGLSALWDWMLAAGIQRGDVVVALGGGVVGDLVGFAAATVLRGVALVQVPTTLLSMVDSSVGGKTAINHSTGKNLIGAFHQAGSVLIDPQLLATLPARECQSGWAEIIKHAVIEPSTPGGNPSVLLDVLERNQLRLSALEEPLLSWVIRRNVALKAAVVAADEREAGIRAFLNFGHTIGHGIEAAGYSLLHGEAIAVGISAALEVALQMDLIDLAFATRIRELLVAYGLPIMTTVDPKVVLQKMQSDKKKDGGRQKWVLPVRTGGVEIRSDVPDDVVWHAICSVTNPVAVPC